MICARSIGTMAITFDGIVERSAGASWSILSEGLALVLTPRGFALTALPQINSGAEVFPERVAIPCEDGRPMQDGHILTEREIEHAVRVILGDAGLSGVARMS
jgi:hypothetical protein